MINSFIFRESTTDNRISVSIPWSNSTYYWDAGSTDANDRLSAAWGGSVDTPYIWSNLFSTTSGQTISSVRQAILRNGFQLATDNTASITICYKYLEWREKVIEMVNTRAGNISIQDMMAWSRLHSEDLDGLRGFCEGSESRQETVAIFKHPKKKPELMGSVWYSGIPCCSVYVPVHNCVNKKSSYFSDWLYT